MQQTILEKGGGGKEKAILQQMVTGGAVEIIGANGPDRGPQTNQAMFAIFDQIKRGTSFDTLRPDDIANGRTTRIVFAQASSLPPAFIGERGRSEVVMCMTFRGQDIQPDGSDGQLSAILTLTPDGFKALYPLIYQKPETAFALLRIVNHKAIPAKDGIVPATIFPGDKVRMMPNIGVKGKLDQVVESNPFPPNFNPNPIF